MPEAVVSQEGNSSVINERKQVQLQIQNNIESEYPDTKSGAWDPAAGYRVIAIDKKICLLKERLDIVHAEIEDKKKTFEEIAEQIEDNIEVKRIFQRQYQQQVLRFEEANGITSTDSTDFR